MYNMPIFCILPRANMQILTWCTYLSGPIIRYFLIIYNKRITKPVRVPSEIAQIKLQVYYNWKISSSLITHPGTHNFQEIYLDNCRDCIVISVYFKCHAQLWLSIIFSGDTVSNIVSVTITVTFQYIHVHQFRNKKIKILFWMVLNILNSIL